VGEIPADPAGREVLPGLPGYGRAYLSGCADLEEMVAANPPDAAKTELIKELEHRCDFLTHEIIQRLHRTFVTPIDREDIHELAKAMDDVMDAIRRLGAPLRPVPDRDGPRRGAQFCHITVRAREQIRSALAHMEKRESVTSVGRRGEPTGERGRSPCTRR